MNRTYTMDFMTASVSQAVDALKIERLHIAGYSMGGYIAADYALRNLQKIMTLCLIDSLGLQNVSPQPSDFQIALKKGHNPLLPSSKKEFAEFITYGFYKKPFLPWPIVPVWAQTAISSRDFRKKMFDDLDLFGKDVDLRPLLTRLTMPVQVFWGDHDRILHVSATEVIQSMLPNAEIVILKDCGHIPIMEKPKETAQTYTNFLNRHGAEHQAWHPAWVSAR